MKIRIQDIKETPENASFAEDPEELNALLCHGVADYKAPRPIDVEISYYRAGMDVFIDGAFEAQFEGRCGRCLMEYPFRLQRSFTLVMAPLSELGPEAKEDGGELSADDLSLSFYSGDEIDLAPIVCEQVILALPTRPLCRSDCRGLCPQCGASRNTDACDCVIEQGDPRLAVLRKLKINV